LNPTFSSTLSNWSDVKNVTWTDTIIGPRAQYTYTSGTYDGQITQVISCSASFDYSVFTRFNIFNSNVTYRLQVLNQSTGEFLLLRDFNGTGLREEGLTFNTGSATSIVVQIIFLTTNFATSGAWVNRLEIFKQNDEILITFPEAHPFLVGDEIKIDKDDKTINISYDGWAEVLGTSTFSVVVDRPVDEPSSFSQLGSIVGLRRLSGFSSNRIAYNGVRQYEELDYDFASKYVLSGYTQSEASFLTTYTGNKLIRKDEYETLSVIVSTQSLNSISIVLTVYDKDGLIIDTPSFLLEGSFNRWDFPVGYESVMVPLGLTAAVKWEVGCVFNANIFDNLKFTYILDESCLKYDPIRLCWLNKLGGIDYYTFTLKSKWRSNVTRKTIKRNLGLEYNVGDFNEDVIGQTIVENWSINSYWLTDDEGLWMRDLIESPKVWMIDGLNLIPIILTSDVYEFKSTLNDELVQYTIEFRKSNNIISNI
jgi:hypothetical protein